MITPPCVDCNSDRTELMRYRRKGSNRNMYYCHSCGKKFQEVF